MLLPEKPPQENHDVIEIENTIATMARIPPRRCQKDDETVIANLDKELRRSSMARTTPSTL
jgi:ATP-dependent Clp protease ATP-binding subunit ClpA